MLKVKCVALGDKGVGKTCLFWCYAMKEFPKVVPTIQDHAICVTKDNSIYNLGLFDAADVPDQKLRALSYPGTDVALVCFDISSQGSFESAKLKWIPEVKQYCPTVPIILVGTKTDLREDISVVQEMEKSNTHLITKEQGLNASLECEVTTYAECSALRNEGVEDVIDTAIDSVLNKYKTRTNKMKCKIC